MAKAKAKSGATGKVSAKTGGKKVKVSNGVETDLVRRVTWNRMATKKTFPQFQTGDSIGVYVKVKEGEKERVQLFTGVVLKMQGSGISKSFTVRKMASGVGVERTFPMVSPSIDRIELISRGKVRRSRLFFLRGLKGRSARLNTEAFFADGGGSAPGAADEAAGDGAAPAAAASASEQAPVEAKK